MHDSQITLNLLAADKATFSNYYSHPKNKELLVHLQAMSKGRGENFLYLWGEKGVGRTHLLHACCNIAQQLQLPTFYLNLKEINQLSLEIFKNLETMHLVCVDDLEYIAGKPNWEEKFFDFFNSMQSAKKRLIVAGNNSPQNLTIQLPDLISRLNSSLSFYIHPLSENEKRLALIQSAQKKGLKLSNEAAKFLLNHCARDIGSLLRILKQLDQAAFSAKRKLTIPFIKLVLGL